MSNFHPAWWSSGNFKCIWSLLSLTEEEGPGSILFPALPFLSQGQGLSLKLSLIFLPFCLTSWLFTCSNWSQVEAEWQLWGHQLKKAGCPLSGALLLLDGIDLGPLHLTLLGASSHLPSLFLRRFRPCDKFNRSHSTSPSCCSGAVHPGAACMLQVGTLRCLFLVFLRTVFVLPSERLRFYGVNCFTVDIHPLYC